MHSDFSADCEVPMEKTIEKAIELGLEEICFTEHIDYDYPDKDWIFEFDLEKYDAKIKEMQDKYQDKIIIKKGVEIGVQPHILEKYNQLMQKESFDFIICSMHTTEQKDLHSGAFLEGKTVEEAHEIYYKELLSCIKEYKNYSVLGHLDLIKRYTKEKSEKDFHEIIREIFNVIIPEGKGIELNTSAERYGLGIGLPSFDILQLYKECGGEIITIGSDSHVPETLAYNFTSGLEQIKAAGINYIAHFTKGIPEFYPIDRLLTRK